MTGSVQIVQLYPVELGITGDRGNVRSLQVRLERAGISTNVQRVSVGEPLPLNPDILVLGNGPLSAMRNVIGDLRTRSTQIEEFVATGGSLLAVGGSAELLGTRVHPLEAAPLEGLGVFDFSVSRTRDRKVGYILADTPVGRVIGFEDHASHWSLGGDAVAYGCVVAGRGSYAHAGVVGEIVRRANAFATNIQGPALPLNPRWTDAILTAATARKGIVWESGTKSAALNDYAAGARSTIERLVHSKDFSTIGL